MSFFSRCIIKITLLCDWSFHFTALLDEAAATLFSGYCITLASIIQEFFMKKALIISILLIITFNVFADKKAEEIAYKNFNLKKSKDSVSTTMMILINKNGEKTIRKMESYSKEGKTGKNSFIKFVEPANIKRTTFLTIGYQKGDDDQRLYLPALGKIRKIASSNKGQKFMGSDLFYYDMEDHDYEEYSYKYIKEEKYDSVECFVIAMYPKSKNAPYSKQICFISKDDYFTHKIECYEKKNENSKIKTIVFKDIKNYNGILVPLKIIVDNHLEKHKTYLQENNLKINTGLSDDIFTIQNMQN